MKNFVTILSIFFTVTVFAQSIDPHAPDYDRSLSNAPNWDEYTAAEESSFTKSVNRVYYRTQNPNIGFGKSSNCAISEQFEFCVNGPLVGQNQLPIGGYIDDSVQKQNWVAAEPAGGNFAVDNAIFGLADNGEFYMVSHSEAYKLPKMKWAFQNGPILVQNGMNVRGTGQTKYARSGIGYKNDGTLVVIVSLEPVTFWQFAELFVQEGCVNAIYLDGGPYVGYSDKSTSVGMVAEATKLQFFNN